MHKHLLNFSVMHLSVSHVFTFHSYLNENHIHQICPGMFPVLTRLHTLSLAHNRIADIERNSFTFPRLLHLWVYIYVYKGVCVCASLHKYYLTATGESYARYGARIRVWVWARLRVWLGATESGLKRNSSLKYTKLQICVRIL